jgi:8-oxo-dGTP pyrophosphatase MutT (NUDIX family)
LLGTRTVVDDRWLRLDAERLETGRGAILDPWYLQRSRAWACAVATVPDGRVVMVEQYRRGVDAWVLELPAGDIDAGEDPAVAAARELAEETGHRASAAPVALGAWFPEPAHSTARAHGFFVSAHADPVATSHDVGEDIVVRLLAPAEVEAAIDSGHLCHAAQIGFWYAARRRGLIGD